VNTEERAWIVRPDSQVVEEQYRLHASDLPRGQRRVRITNITYQGVEEVRLLLHFAEITKPLALNDTQCRAVIDSTGSGHVPDWIGQTITLAAEMQNGVRGIRIGPGRAADSVWAPMRTEPGALAAATSAVNGAQKRSIRSAILLALLLALFLLLVSLLEQSEQLWSLFGL